MRSEDYHHIGYSKIKSRPKSGGQLRHGSRPSTLIYSACARTRLVLPSSSTLVEVSPVPLVRRRSAGRKAALLGNNSNVLRFAEPPELITEYLITLRHVSNLCGGHFVPPHVFVLQQGEGGTRRGAASHFVIHEQDDAEQEEETTGGAIVLVPRPLENRGKWNIQLL